MSVWSGPTALISWPHRRHSRGAAINLCLSGKWAGAAAASPPGRISTMAISNTILASCPSR